MSTTNELYSELKDDVAVIVSPLFDASEFFIQNRGEFHPHAAVLMANGEVRKIAAAPKSDTDLVSSVDVLPLLHEGIRQQNQKSPIIAVGVAEQVTITLEGNKTTNAIKVLFEHQKGLNVAFYLPFKKKFFKGYMFGESFMQIANAEVNVWANSH